MGGKCPHRSVKKRRYSHKQFRRGKFLVKGDDAVYDELNKPEEQRNALPVDEDLPGMGQYYCMHCDVKMMMGPKPHTQLDAELAAGMGMPDNGPKLMSMS
ncbi:zinc finger protein 593 homolog isoform X2 [Capsicum annuum]|uniref:zinc finger protein 593 homolog isoform X2 n=1 Tax=Capsicum annuum TaxID=4072 RepID=UPI001FB1302B|nr:zinc finger protein 593 homolog isoform X2 [Capsicum annuum]